MKVKIKKLSSTSIIPSYSKDGDAGMDYVATRVIKEDHNQISYGTDLAIEIPYGYVGLIFPRSSIRNYDLVLSNSVGVIDSGYRGEIQATFNKKDWSNPKVYNVGDRIFQMIIIPYPLIELEQSDELSDSERSNGGFGSTGK